MGGQQRVVVLHYMCFANVLLCVLGCLKAGFGLASCVSASLAATGRRPCLKRSLHHLSHWRAHLPCLDHSKRGRKQGSTTQAVSSSYGLWGASLSPRIIAQVPYVSEKALVRDLCLSPPLTSQAEAHHLRGKLGIGAQFNCTCIGGPPGGYYNLAGHALLLGMRTPGPKHARARVPGLPAAASPAQDAA